MFALRLVLHDDPARIEARPAHRERMAQLNAEGKVLASGPYADDSGALLLLLVDTRAEAEGIVAADPYFSAPGVAVASLDEWNPVVKHERLEWV